MMDDLVDLDYCIKHPNMVPPSVVRDLAWAVRTMAASMKSSYEGNVGAARETEIMDHFALIDSAPASLDEYFDRTFPPGN